jgi:hypothetical protein
LTETYKTRRPRHFFAVGTVYGQLTLTGACRLCEIPNSDRRTYKYQGICSCSGREVWARAWDLIKGKVGSCGCTRTAKLQSSRKRKEVPQPRARFGNLEVMERVCVKTDTKVECSCICGTIFMCPVSSLWNGRRTSCGLRRCRANVLEGRKLSVSRLLKVYRADAAKRQLVFDLEPDMFASLILMDCFYCGREPQSNYTVLRKQADSFELRHNGIDRFDNSQGYVSSNCVACCSQCNFAKHNRTAEDFIRMCQLVAANHRQKEQR